MNSIDGNIYDVSVALGRTVSARAYRSNGKGYHELIGYGIVFVVCVIYTLAGE